MNQEVTVRVVEENKERLGGCYLLFRWVSVGVVFGTDDHFIKRRFSRSLFLCTLVS